MGGHRNPPISYINQKKNKRVTEKNSDHSSIILQFYKKTTTLLLI